jgi:hypothetical protein
MEIVFFDSLQVIVQITSRPIPSHCMATLISFESAKDLLLVLACGDSAAKTVHLAADSGLQLLQAVFTRADSADFTLTPKHFAAALKVARRQLKYDAKENRGENTADIFLLVSSALDTYFAYPQYALDQECVASAAGLDEVFTYYLIERCLDLAGAHGGFIQHFAVVLTCFGAALQNGDSGEISWDLFQDSGVFSRVCKELESLESDNDLRIGYVCALIALVSKTVLKVADIDAIDDVHKTIAKPLHRLFQSIAGSWATHPGFRHMLTTSLVCLLDILPSKKSQIEFLLPLLKHDVHSLIIEHGLAQFYPRWVMVLVLNLCEEVVYGELDILHVCTRMFLAALAHEDECLKSSVAEGHKTCTLGVNRIELARVLENAGKLLYAHDVQDYPATVLVEALNASPYMAIVSDVPFEHLDCVGMYWVEHVWRAMKCVTKERVKACMLETFRVECVH